MNRNLLFGATVLFMLASCSTDTTIGDLTTESNSVSKNSANNTLKYYNSVVQYDETARKHLEEVNEDIAEIAFFTEQKKVTTIASVTGAYTGMPLTNEIGIGSDKVDLLEPNKLLDDILSQKVKTKVNAMINAYNKTKETYEELREYINTEDFIDDDWLKASKLISKAKTNIESYNKNSDEFFKIIKPATSKAEEVILEDHPLKEDILFAKKTLNSANLVLNEVKEVNPNMTELNKKYDELEKISEEAAKMDTKVIKEQYKDHSHQYFYDQVKTFLGEVRKSKRDETITNLEYDDILHEFEKIISYYNSFVG